MSVSVLPSTYVCLDYINPLVTNGLSHPYHLDESTLTVKFHFVSFFDEIHVSKQNNPRWPAAVWSFSDSLCPIRGHQAYNDGLSLVMRAEWPLFGSCSLG